jgi:hypothetical protein
LNAANDWGHKPTLHCAHCNPFTIFGLPDAGRIFCSSAMINCA